MNTLGATFVFMGNGPVASQSLRGLVDSFGIEAVEAVITKTRPAHHKDPAPVEELAKELSLPLWFASTKSELDDIVVKNAPKSQFGIVIDYGVVISGKTIAKFPKGIINSHFSLLPEWRGADPITYSLLSGQSKTGVSLMLIDEGLDTGPLLAHADYDLNGTETSQELTGLLVELNNRSLEHIIPLWLSGKTWATEQTDLTATYSRKLTKQDGALVFTKTAAELEREVRAFSGWPKSRTTIGSIDCVITAAKTNTTRLNPGTISITESKTLLIGARIGSLEIIELQPAGKNKMPAAAFINGYGHLL